MAKRGNPYHEQLLHWIWESLRFDYGNLQSTRGEAIEILHPGTSNPTDGPDFLNASLIIGSLRWYGDVEIHWQESDWSRHRHHRDPNYNRVVLHLVYKPVRKLTAMREDGTAPATAVLKPLLKQPLRSFLDGYHSPRQLPCAGHFSYISQQAFEKQIEKSHAEYFEQKTNDLLQFYDASLPLSIAWKKMLAVALFDGLGITHNRLAMQRLCNKLYPKLHAISTAGECIREAHRIADLQGNTDSTFGWNHKGCRPANHPALRISQAAAALWVIHGLPLRDCLAGNNSCLWQRIISQAKLTRSIGRQRASILYGTVWLPALFILGNLLGSHKIQSSAYRGWLGHSAEIPASLLAPFSRLPLPPRLYRKKLGAIYQLRKGCSPRNCAGCEVFKSVISA